jgi:hypothetical protein
MFRAWGQNRTREHRQTCVYKKALGSVLSQKATSMAISKPGHWFRMPSWFCPKHMFSTCIVFVLININNMNMKNRRAWRGYAVVQLVEALCYKPEGRGGFDSRSGHWTFQLTESSQPHCGPGVDSACDRNE